MVLVERAHRGGTDGEAAGPIERTTRHQAQGSLVHDRFGSRGDTSPLGEQPRLERRCPPDDKTVEQLGTETDGLDGAGPLPAEHVDVDSNVLREPQHHGIPFDGGVVTEAAADLRQAPPQRTQRVISLREQHPGQLAPRRAGLDEQEVGEQRPTLSAAETAGRLTVALDGRATQETDR